MSKNPLLSKEGWLRHQEKVAKPPLRRRRGGKTSRGAKRGRPGCSGVLSIFRLLKRRIGELSEIQRHLRRFPRHEYNDVRINRFALSLLRVYKKPIPDVFRDEVMNPIGASTTWKWVPYANAYVDIDGKRMPSVSGGTRWGGGVWINSVDMARFGLLWLRNGKWGDRQIVSPAYVKMATTPSAHGPDYGFLWWLNTKQGQWPRSPANAYWALGSGGNYVYIDPSHDLLVVWRWSSQSNEGFRRVVEAVMN